MMFSTRVFCRYPDRLRDREFAKKRCLALAQSVQGGRSNGRIVGEVVGAMLVGAAVAAVLLKHTRH